MPRISELCYLIYRRFLKVFRNLVVLWLLSNKVFYWKTSYFRLPLEGLKHRLFEVSLAHLQSDEVQAHSKIRLGVEDVQGRNVLTNISFYFFSKVNCFTGPMHIY